MENKIKELVAIGASITANCQPCLEYHKSKAIEFGVSEFEIKEAIEVGNLVRRGAASKMDKFVLSLDEGTQTNSISESKCGCEVK